MTSYPYDTAGLVANPKMQALRDATRAAEQRCREAVMECAMSDDGGELPKCHRQMRWWIDAARAEIDAAGPPPEPAPSVDWTDPRWGPSVRFAEPIRASLQCLLCQGSGIITDFDSVGVPEVHQCAPCKGMGIVT